MILFPFPLSPHIFLITVDQDDKSTIVILAGLRWLEVIRFPDVSTSIVMMPWASPQIRDHIRSTVEL